MKSILIYGVPSKEYYSDVKDKIFYVAELRPDLAGAKIAANQLIKSDADVTLVSDNMIGFLMYKGLIEEAHVFYHKLEYANAVCRTGSMIAAICAKNNNIRLDLYPAAEIEKKAKSGGVLYFNKELVGLKNNKTYEPQYENLALDYASGIHQG